MTSMMFALLVGAACFGVIQLVTRVIPWYARRQACKQHGHDWKPKIEWRVGKIHPDAYWQCSFCKKVGHNVHEAHPLHPAKKLPIIRRPMKVKAEVEFLEDTE